MNAMEKILITGGSGYIGQNLIKRLINQGKTVYAVVRPSTDISSFDKFRQSINILEWDGSDQSIIKIIETAKPDAVIHLASLFIVQHKPQDILPMIQSNISFGTLLLEACAQCGVGCFVNTATHWQHYNLEPYNPVNLYASTKQAYEDIIRFYTEAYGIRALTVRIIDTYGPFDPRGKVVSLFKRLLQSGETIEMSPGEQELGLLYIDDIVNAFILALEKVQKIEKYKSVVAAPPAIYTLREVAGVFEKVSGKKLNIIWGAKPYRPRDMMKVWNKEENILEGQGALDLPEGFARMLKIESEGEKE
jgi:nucleoside-diphosphate-sugar epimerase